MQKSEMAVCLGYLYSRYPTKMQARVATETFYQVFKDYNSNVFTWILDQYHGEYFPTVEEIAELIKDQKRIQEDILNDPRNPFYAKVSPEAGERRAKKLRRADYILKALSAEERKFIKQ